MVQRPQSAIALTVVLAGALLWGVYWVPVRELEAAGLPGAWAGLALALAALPVLAGLAAWRPGPMLSARSVLGAAALGAALALYAAAIVYTDVVRAILIFYLAPAWSLLIEAAFLGRRLGWQSGLAVLVSLAGIGFVFRGEIPLDGIGALGDWMALASGVCWSVAAAMLFSSKAPDLRQTGLVAMAAAVLVSLAVIALDPTVSGEGPDRAVLQRAVPVALLFGILFNAPIILLTIWGAIKLRPATVTFLLTAEIISGVVSSAVLLDEPFGLFEILGTALIIAGALIELLFPPSAAKPTTAAEHR